MVLDVLRATTTMVAALSAGCREIRVFGDVEETRSAAAAFDGPKLLCGERRALPPSGFDLGNSPGDFTAVRCAGKTLFMTTTNGTPAILAAGSAPEVLVASLANLSATADHLLLGGQDVTLLCAGQRGDVAMEDLIGAGAIVARLLERKPSLEKENDAAHIAALLFRSNAEQLPQAFWLCLGARTELAHGLSADIDYCAVMDRFNTLATLKPPNVVRRLDPIDPAPAGP